MKILYIHQYFKTPKEGGSLRSYYLAKALVKAGHEVAMITAHNQPTQQTCTIEGIKVTYLPIQYSNEMSFSRRIVAFLKFAVLASFVSVRQRDIDLCYVMTTPLTTGFIALFNQWILRRPYVFEVGDLWPKVPIEMGIIRSKMLQFILHGIERFFYHQSTGLVGLSAPITAHLQNLAPEKPMATIPNIAHCASFKLANKTEQGAIKDQFVISYTGTFGVANDLRTIVNWANYVADLPITIRLVGNGAEKEKVCQLIATQHLSNVKVLDAMDQSGIQEIVNSSDALLVSFADYPSLWTGSPNKLFDALAAGKLVITNFDGWVGALIASQQCGFVAHNGSEFRSKLESYISSPSLLNSHQLHARKLAKAQYDLPIIEGLFIEFLEGITHHDSMPFS